jgi:hypothetical protein
LVHRSRTLFCRPLPNPGASVTTLALRFATFSSLDNATSLARAHPAARLLSLSPSLTTVNARSSPAAPPADVRVRGRRPRTPLEAVTPVGALLGFRSPRPQVELRWRVVKSMGHGGEVPLWGLLPLVNMAAVELASDERWVGAALTPLLSLETFCASLR